MPIKSAKLRYVDSANFIRSDHTQLMPFNFIIFLFHLYFDLKYAKWLVHTLGSFSVVSIKIDNLCDFLFPLLHTKSFLKIGPV